MNPTELLTIFPNFKNKPLYLPQGITNGFSKISYNRNVKNCRKSEFSKFAKIYSDFLKFSYKLSQNFPYLVKN